MNNDSQRPSICRGRLINITNQPSAEQPAARCLRFAALVLVAGGLVIPAFGVDVTLTASDANGTSSFTDTGGVTNWNSGQPPTSGNAYLTAAFALRTPTNNGTLNPGSILFAGDSLEINTGGTLVIKSTNTISVGNLILNGGTIQEGVVTAGTPGGTPDLAVLTGSINLRANSVLKGSVSGLLDVQSTITNDGVGALLTINTGPVRLSAANTFAGNVTVASSGSTNVVLQLGADNATPSTAQLTLNNATAFSTVLDLFGHSTAVSNLVISSGGTFQGIVTNSVFGTTGTLTIGSNAPSGASSTLSAGQIVDNPSLGGTVALTKVGAGTLTLGSATLCKYSGDTTVNGGKLVMGASLILPWGNGRGNLVVNSPGTINLSGRDEAINGLSGNGTVDNSGTGNSTLHLGSNDVTTTFSGVIQSTNTGLLELIKWGAGTQTLSGANTFNGSVTINAGVLRITQSSGLGTGPKTNVVINSAGDAQLHLDGSGGSIVLDASHSFQTASANGAIVNEAGNNTINGDISLITGGATKLRVDGGTLTLAGNINILSNVTSRKLMLDGAANGTVSGVISDGSVGNILALTKAGASTWTLTSANTYSDITTINNGTLTLGALGSISNSSTINVQSNGCFNVSAIAGGWTLEVGNSMKGSGVIKGNVTANGNVAPGDHLIGLPIGTLTFSNNLTLAGVTLLEIDRTNAPNADRLVASALTFGGTLTVTNLGDPLVAGDTFNLFDGSLSGIFATTNLPSLTTGLTWDASLLASQGVIKVASLAAPQPVIQHATAGGTNLNLQYASESGFSYYLESTTNLATAVWSPVLTNAGGGTITNQVPINPAKAREFFRVRASAP